MSVQPGPVVLLSSGETAASGRRVLDWLLGRWIPPVRIALLETPAGFQPNSEFVAEKVADFMRHHLQNHQLQVDVVPARKLGTPFSPDHPQIVAPLRKADVIYAGAGSPTYAVRNLKDTLAWYTLLARHRLGAGVVFASAATIAASAQALPVYEIYKVGEDPHWAPGLDLFGAYGLSLALVGHWDNTEGGADLDTSRGFIGQARFEQLRATLPSQVKVVGIDEHTALIVDLPSRTCQVIGLGGVTLCQEDEEQRYLNGQTFSIMELGPFSMPDPRSGIPVDVWEQIEEAQRQDQAVASAQPPAEVLALVEQRETARARRDWSQSDVLRDQIAAWGWEVHDTPNGPELNPLP
jgi:hypothetical protein